MDVTDAVRKKDSKGTPIGTEAVEENCRVCMWSYRLIDIRRWVPVACCKD